MNHAAPSAWRLQAHTTVSSTQDLAIRAAQAGDPGRLAVLADVQTTGRGSRGRSWVAHPGNLHLSLLLRPIDARPDPGHWAMLAGVALHAALSPHAPSLMLKWPNDVLLDGAKVGGVLIDSSLRSDGTLDWVVIGMGANLVHAPAIDGRRTAHLPPPAPPARDMAHAVLREFDRHLGWDIRAAWLARAHPPGTPIDVATPDRRIRGRFAGLDPSGALLLEGHAQPISSAEIFLPQPSPPCFS